MFAGELTQCETVTRCAAKHIYPERVLQTVEEADRSAAS